MSKANKAARIFLTVLAFILLLAAFIFSFLQSFPITLEDGNESTQILAPSLYLNNIEDLGNKYPKSISPADWVFAIIWPIIYLWNIIGMLYLIASCCLSKENSPIMREPAMVPIPSLMFMSMAWGFSFSWVFLNDREYMGGALAVLIIAAWSAYLCLTFSYRSYEPEIIKLEQNNAKMLWLVRILFHNGFAIFTTWLTCAWKLAFCIVVTYVPSREIDKIPADIGLLGNEDTGTVAISWLLIELIVWFILENFFFEKYCRYTMTIYPTIIFALTGIFIRNYNTQTDESTVYPRSQVVTLTGLVVACVAFAARVILVTIRHIKRPRRA